MKVNQWAPNHCHTLASGHPILALDMLRAFLSDVGAKAGGYVDVFMEAVRWRAPTNC